MCMQYSEPQGGSGLSSVFDGMVNYQLAEVVIHLPQHCLDLLVGHDAHQACQGGGGTSTTTSHRALSTVSHTAVRVHYVLLGALHSIKAQ